MKVIEFHTNLTIFLSGVDPATPQLDFAVRRRQLVHLSCKRPLLLLCSFPRLFPHLLMRIAMRICDLAASLWAPSGCTTRIESAIWLSHFGWLPSLSVVPFGCRTRIESAIRRPPFGAFWMQNTNRICDLAVSLWTPSGCTTRIESAIWRPPLWVRSADHRRRPTEPGKTGFRPPCRKLCGTHSNFV